MCERDFHALRSQAEADFEASDGVATLPAFGIGAAMRPGLLLWRMNSHAGISTPAATKR
jgi:hypothetical protein